MKLSINAERIEPGLTRRGAFVCAIAFATLSIAGTDPLTPPLSRHSGPAPQKQFPSSHSLPGLLGGEASAGALNGGNSRLAREFNSWYSFGD